MKSLLELRGLLYVALGIAGLVSASPPVKVSLRSSWAEVPLLLEILESVSNEHADAFFPLLESLTANLPATSSRAPEAVHEYALQTALSLGYLKEPGALSAVELQLALHAATPKIQAFYQYYIDQHFTEQPDCGSWVDWYGETICDLDTLMRLVGHETIDPSNYETPASLPRPKVLPFDHVNPTISKHIPTPPHTAIFYGTPSSPNFRELHSYLLKLSNGPQPRIEYVYRHRPAEGKTSQDSPFLSGYGVSLDLKKMDYLALDDRHSSASGSANEESDMDISFVEEDLVLSLLQSYPENFTLDTNAPLTEDEFLEIGIQSTQLIMDAPSPLRALKQLSQNFPKYATSVARRVSINASLEQEIEDNQVKAQGGINMMWLNGLHVQESDMTPLGLLRLLRRERSVILSLMSLDFSAEQAVNLVTDPLIGAAQSDTGVLDGIFDASDRPEGGSVIVWWNDFTKDKRYARWGSSLTGLLHPVYPGQFHNVKQNLFNVILVMDMSQTSSLNFVAGAVSSIISRNFPFRFGVVPSIETDNGKKMARLFYYLLDNYGRAKTMSFLGKVSQIQTPIELLTPSVNWVLLRSEFKSLVDNSPPTDDDLTLDFDDIISDENTDFRISRAREYAVRLDADRASSPTGHAFVNGKHFDMDDEFLRYMQIEQAAQLAHLQEKIYLGELGDVNATTIETYFYDLPEASIRRNRYIYPTSQTGSLRISNLLEAFSRSGFQPSSGSFIYPTESDRQALTTFVVADLDSDAGIALMREAVESLESASTTRLSFIHNPETGDGAEVDKSQTRISHLISYLSKKDVLYKISPSTFKEVLEWRLRSLPDSFSQTIFSSESPVHHLLRDSDVDYDDVLDAESYRRFCLTSRAFAQELGASPGEHVLVVNGRIVGPIDGEDNFKVGDFKALEAYEMRRRVGPVVNALTNMNITTANFDRATYNKLVSMASSVIASVQLPDASEQGLFNTNRKVRQRNYRFLDGHFTSFEFGDRNAVYNFGVLVDPLSELAQKWSSILEWLATIPSVHVEVHLNPARYHELPLKRFYRYNLSPRLTFDSNGLEQKAQTVFNDLPADPIYTLGMDVPPAWLVRPREALHDLDNIQLSRLSNGDRKRGVEAVFELDFIVIEGHARDALTNSPPRGLQLQLATLDSSPIDDTQVVANLGYFQFKAKPGVFQMEIREGRGRDVFVMESVGNDGWHSANVSQVGNDVTLTSFEGLTIYPRVRRRPGMDKADVLDEFVMGDKRPSGWFDNIASKVSKIFHAEKHGDNQAIARRQADINIFTVASGLLYERFASIMILSVLRNTNSTVKFWFIENFLSPSFLEFIPHFAEEYGFEYELVTYKWPSWLRAQKEKQRIIWAYKILFLDVLFPMDLKKVIFVDADQIVRADLKELVDLDLHGAPYGYTPMGDDNHDMEGFRFWKTGYWKDFLRGRPYHIRYVTIDSLRDGDPTASGFSALYVVDLVRFRQVAAGDILRGSYQQLSADPNSLANLDQDLPNNLQREVPIFSLPEDWLWCETWCSKDRLHRAKTIDLCQNPLTKEPKLARARAIPEWEEYDTEIARFARSLADRGAIRSHVAAVDVNALASAGAAAAPSPEKQDSEGSGDKTGATGQESSETHVRDEL